MVEGNFTLGDLFPEFVEHLENVDSIARQVYGDQSFNMVQVKVQRCSRDAMYSHGFFKQIDWKEPDQIIQDVQGITNGLMGQVMIGRSGDRLTEESVEEFNSFQSDERSGRWFIHAQNEVSDVSYPSSSFEMVKEAYNNDIEVFNLELMPEYLENVISEFDSVEYQDIALNQEDEIQEVLEEGRKDLLNDLSNVTYQLDLGEIDEVGDQSHRKDLLDEAEKMEGVTAVSTYDKRVLRDSMSGDYSDVTLYTPRMLAKTIRTNSFD